MIVVVSAHSDSSHTDLIAQFSPLVATQIVGSNGLEQASDAGEIFIAKLELVNTGGLTRAAAESAHWVVRRLVNSNVGSNKRRHLGPLLDVP